MTDGTAERPALATTTAHVAVTMPCYNRPAGLQRTIDCLRAQTHADWTALIGDNASTDPAVEEVARRACREDARFTYLRREHNIGVGANFGDLAARGRGDYFMWAADDDVLEPEFMAECLRLFADNPSAGLVAPTIDNINRQDAHIRSYPGYSRFSSTPTPEGIRAFLLDPEVMGKQVMLYGLYRMPALQAAIAEYWSASDFDLWGGDMVFVYGFICRYAVVGTDKVLLHKRVATDATDISIRHHPNWYFVPRREYPSYVQRHIAVSPNAEFAAAVKAALRKRYWTSRLYRYLARLGIEPKFTPDGAAK